MGSSRHAAARRRRALVGWCAVLTTSCVVLGSLGSLESATVFVDGSAAADAAGGGLELDGEVVVVGAGVELVWQRPAGVAKGVLALLHGCSHRGTDAWPAGARCGECAGLPVETRIVGAALARGWAVVAVTSEDRGSGCWSGGDAPRVAAAIDHVRAASDAGPLTAALGASSGGAMATAVPGVGAAVAQVMASHARLDATHPPVRFVHMARDDRTAQRVARQLDRLREARVDAGEYVVHPEPVTADALFQRGPGPGGRVLPTRALAAAAAKALEDGGFLDGEKRLTEDPRRSQWRAALRPVVPRDVDSFVADESPVSEVLNAAWAAHEFTDAFLDETLDWLDSAAARLRT